MTPLRKIARSTVFRVSMLFALVFTVVTIGVFGALYLKLSKELDNKLKDEITETRDTILDSQHGKFPGELAKVVARYAAFDQKIDEIYLLTDAEGNFVSGNIRPIPRFDGWKRLELKTLPFTGVAKEREPGAGIVATWTTVNNGFLLVGDRDEDIIEAREVLLDALIGGTVITVFLAAIGATLLGAVAQRRVRGMETALEAVDLGALDVRVPRYASSDDFDKVGARINLTLDRLQNLIGALRQVTTDIAHDLRTPIGHIRQRLEAALSAPVAAQNHQATIQSAIQGLDSVVETFDSLLRVAEIEAGARKSLFTDLDLRQVIDSITESYELVAADVGHTLVVKLVPGRAVYIQGDRRLLMQLFVNVIENAIRHCPPGSKICVDVGTDGKTPVVTISDNGPGIPEAERAFVFRRLYRLEKSRTTLGNGLGLSLVSAIAGLHDASIELSDNNPGLIVTVRFPVRDMRHHVL